MHDQDYDNDGNNIVPCPICLDVYCPSKQNGKCPEEDEFVMYHTPTKQLLKMAMQNVGMCFQIIFMRLLIKIIKFRNRVVIDFHKWINDNICTTSLTERFANLDTTLGDTQKEGTSEGVNEITIDGEYAGKSKKTKEGKAANSDESKTSSRT